MTLQSTQQSDSLCLQGTAHFNICQEEGAFNLNKVLCYSLTLFIAFYLYRSINIPESLYSHLLTDGGVTSFVLCSLLASNSQKQSELLMLSV